jgi:dTDP-4-dehydrorhamnose 3,5-epimerase
MGRAIRRADSPRGGHPLKFTKTAVEGVCIIELDADQDERGFFARIWDCEQMAENGVDPNIVQCSISYNRDRATLRGMHYQTAPHEETKTVRCTAGEIYDVALDVRRDSPTYRKWVGVELTAGNRKTLYIPKGVAHGFMTLTPNAEIFYQMGVPYAAGFGAGVRWDDPAFRIDWPMKPLVMNERDRNYADWKL